MSSALPKNVNRRGRKFLLLATLWSAALLADDLPPCGAGLNEVRLHVIVSGMHSARGNITITVYPDNAARFLAKGGKLSRQRVPTTLPATGACFSLPAPGSYAVTVYHDEDGDNKFKRTLIGLPDEGYGFSNNPKTLIGLPSLREVRFPAAVGDTSIDIALTY